MQSGEKKVFRGESLDPGGGVVCPELLDIVSSGVLVVDNEYNIRFLNGLMVGVLGGNKKKILGMDLFEATSGIDENVLRDLFQRASRTKKIAKRLNVKRKYEDNQVMFCDIFVYPFLNKLDKVIGYVLMLEGEIIARKYLNSAHRTNRFVRYIVDTMLEGATIIDEEGKLEYANRKFYHLLGYEPDEILGQHWTSWCHEDDLEMDGDKKRIKNERVKDGVHHYRVRLRRKDNTYVSVLLLVSKQKEGEFSIKSVGLITDISQTIRLETNYKEISLLNKKILETISTGIITLDKNLVIKSINNKVENLYGKKIDRVVGLDLGGAYPDLQVFCEWSGWVLRSQKPYQVDRYKLKVPELRGEIFVNVRINPLFDQNNQVVGVVCAFDDVTSSALLEEKIEASYRKLETTHNRLSKLLERQKDFLADVSHELRTPLTVISGNVEVAMQDKYIKYDELVDVLKLVENEARRMSSLVEDLMSLAKMEGGEIKLNYSKFYSSDLLLDLEEKINIVSIEERQINFGIIDRVLLRADKDMVGELLWNLVENAIKYTRKNGKIMVEITRSALDGKDLILTVSDNGIGIPDSQLEDIFERFYRIDKARNRASGGSGLGLSIAQWIAREHGGSIEVESELNKGSIFRVVMPVVVKD